MNVMKRAAIIGLLLAVSGVGWMSRGELVRLVPLPFLPMAPHDQYSTALRLAGLSATVEGRAWEAAAEAGLEHPLEASPRFSTAGAFDGASSAVIAWRFPARRGQRVTIDMGVAPDTLFLDLFTVDGRNRAASLPAGNAILSYVVEQDGDLIARVQPRIDRPATYAIAQRIEASLRFPVHARDGRAVQSGFGAARDAGARRHEGIDIFAPRGTPVVAAVDGWITRQTTNRLGGNVVWVWSPSRGLSLYYAHLDRHAVTPGQRVHEGDVVGYVGNTGNARGTAPHLHFGVYASIGGAVDPFPFVVDPVMPRQPGNTGKHQ